MNSKSFSERVLEIVGRIPKGQVLSYKEVARRAGRPLAYRAVGNILKQNHDPKIPCHRVIRANGTLGGFNRGADTKAKLLREEKAILI